MQGLRLIGIGILFFCGQIALAREAHVEFVNRINSKTYVFKKGDTLSKILQEHGYTPLFGLDGFVKRTLHKNGMRKSDINKIEPGTVIMLPYEDKIETIAPSDDRARAPASLAVTPIEVDPEPEETDDTSFSLIFSNSLLALESTDKVSSAKAGVESKIGYGLTYKWSQHLGANKNWETFILGSLSQTELISPRTKELNKTKVGQFYQGIGLGYHFEAGHSFGVNVGQGQSLILVTKEDDTLEVTPKNLMTVSLYGNHSLLSFKRFNFNFSWRLGQLQPDSGENYKVKNGQYTNYNLGVSYKKKSVIVFGSFGLTRRELETDLTIQTSQEVSSSLGVGFAF